MAKVREAEAEGPLGSIIQQVTYKMAQMVHFWVFKPTAKTLSAVKLGLCRGSPRTKKTKITKKQPPPAVMFRLQAGIPTPPLLPG